VARSGSIGEWQLERIASVVGSRIHRSAHGALPRSPVMASVARRERRRDHRPRRFRTIGSGPAGIDDGYHPRAMTGDDDRSGLDPGTDAVQPPAGEPAIPAPPGPSVPAGPVWRWEPPNEQRGLGVGGLIRGAFALYGRAFSAMFATALVQTMIQVVLWIPIAFIEARAIGRMVDVFKQISPPPLGSNYDPIAYQAQFEEQMRAAVTPDPGLAALNAIASGIGVPMALVFVALFTAIGLSAYEGGTDSPRAAIRAVTARLTSFLVPGVLLGLGVLILSLPFGITQPAFSGSGRTAEGARVGLLLGALGIVVAIVAVYFAIRWSLAIPAMLAERLGVRAGLRRSSELTRGIRLRIFGALLVVALCTFVVEVVGLVVAVVLWVSTGSVAVGVAAGVVLFLALLVSLTPFYPALTVVIYKDRVPAAEQPTAAPAG
jgi:Membrane domain of glycerophosphoryl diester phosphodiesterase